VFARQKGPFLGLNAAGGKQPSPRRGCSAAGFPPLPPPRVALALLRERDGLKRQPRGMLVVGGGRPSGGIIFHGYLFPPLKLALVFLERRRRRIRTGDKLKNLLMYVTLPPKKEAADEAIHRILGHEMARTPPLSPSALLSR
jgi:hypothetical protein